MQTITTIAELDEKIAECDRARKISDVALRQVFASFRMAQPESVPDQPLSEEYARFQASLYEQLAGKPYRVENEGTQFNIDSAVTRPFPYSTGGAVIAADQYTAIGALLRRLDVRPGARILEFGPGWGNTTLALALLGFQVTCVDIEPRFCELIRRRAALHGVSIDVVNADFHWAESVREPYEAVIFFECFHHAADHRGLLRALHMSLVPEGQILFGGEPISPDFPVPWGLRLDGQSLWSIRKHGWFELGFNDSYFAKVLAVEGWSATKHASGDTHQADVWEARWLTAKSLLFLATDPRFMVPSEMRDASGICLSNLGQQWGFFGPYVTLPAGNWLGRVVLRPNTRRSGQGTLDVSTDRGTCVLASRKVDLEGLTPHETALEIAVHLPQATTDVEVRLYCEHDCTLSVDRIELARQP